ncbi:MAG TPA: DUF1684 domain-containing protein [Candidatus Acidoferrales bacterium]
MKSGWAGWNKTTVSVVLCLASATISVGARPDTATYRQAVEKWRQAYEAELKSDSGWLTVSGLFWLHEGENTFGSGPLNDIVLPPSAPASAGSFRFHLGRTTVRLTPGVAATLNGKPAETAEMHPDSDTDQLAIGDLALYVHSSGDRYTIRLRDKNSRLRKDFTGTRWFPVDESYRVTAQYVPYDKPKQIEIQNVMGDTLRETIPGYAAFSFHGQALRLDAELNGSGGLSVVFRDLTSGKETYAASRFLEADPPKDGRVVLDFNEAYNPPCAYNPYTTCPLPPPQNRLPVRIEAGEKIYHHADSTPVH